MSTNPLPSTPAPSSPVWDNIYVSKSEQDRSWTQEAPTEALKYISEMDLAHQTPIVDVGGGSSHLIQELLARDFADLTVLDISSKALEEAIARINASGLSSADVEWVVSDIRAWNPTRSYGLWHDRAVFHFLVTSEDQRLYVEKASKYIAPGGHLLIGTFAPDGPEMCSGMPVQRWSPEGLAEAFSASFTVIDAKQTLHETPFGHTQPFTWIHLIRNG